MDADGGADSLLQVQLASSVEVVVDGQTLAVTGPHAAPLPAPRVHVLTGHNPQSTQYSALHNTWANERLGQLLSGHASVTGVWPARGFAGNWSEASLAVAGLERVDAVCIAQVFDQYSVFELDEHVVCVIRCADGFVVCRPRRKAC